MGFGEAYRQIRNRARRFDPESIVLEAQRCLAEPANDALADLKRAPWQLMLLVKWVCQDDQAKSRRRITRAELDVLRQMMWNLPERIDVGQRDSLPLSLFLRQIMHAQVSFQRPPTAGILREAALLTEMPQQHVLRRMFESRTGLRIQDFLDLSMATFTAIIEGRRQLNYEWFRPLTPAYPQATIERFIGCVSRTFGELVGFCRALPDAKRKVASELYQFPVLSRFPFIQRDRILDCWHPMVFHRGIEGYVHSVLSEAGADYMDSFSKLFENHVVREAKRVETRFIDEAELRSYLPPESEVPDGLISFPQCNIFVESKAGVFDESVMTVGHNTMFARKTRSLRKAIGQGWSASTKLREKQLAPRDVLNTEVDYLLVVTNKELGASRGTTLAGIYPEGTLDHASPRAKELLPLERIYVVSIEDFERLIGATVNGDIELPEFLDACVEADSDPKTSRFYLEQHLTQQRVPLRRSTVIQRALDDSTERLSAALS